jgi:hypothetical protein
VRWVGYPSLALTIECGGEPHVVTWSAGRLGVPEHDREGEAVLQALGAPARACGVFGDAWRTATPHDNGPIVLPLLRSVSDRWPESERAAHLRERLAEACERPAPARVPVPAGMPERHVAAFTRAHLDHRTFVQLKAIAVALPTPWLGVVLAGHLADIGRWERVPGDDRAAVRTVIGRLATQALEQCAGPRFPMPTVRVSEWSVAGLVDGCVVVPPAWITRVLARQATVIDGELVLDLVPHVGGDGRFVAQRLHVAAGRRLTVRPTFVRLAADGWHSA